MVEGDNYLSLPFGKFLEDVAARKPSPGGGSVAAAAGALSVAMARMVLEYTASKKKHAEHEPRLRALLDELKRASELFAQLIQEDIAAYERYDAARKSGDPGEQAEALALAVAVPMELAALAEAVAARVDEVKPFVGPALYSDVQVAVLLACATAEAAGATVAGNLLYLTDKDQALETAGALEGILTRSRAHRDAIMAFRPAG